MDPAKAAEFAGRETMIKMVKNKKLRREMSRTLKGEKRKAKKRAREDAEKEDPTGEERAKKVPRTKENTREKDETYIQGEDEEVEADEATDEFAACFGDGKHRPKILITTSPRPVGDSYLFARELQSLFQWAEYHARRDYELKEIVEIAKRNGFTDLIVINEDRKKPNGILLCHLPDGPTARFKLSSFVPTKEIKNHAGVTMHRPELVLNNFNTRLGHTVGRMLGALFPNEPEFRGRRVATFHNQRDFIFFRQHRYVFRNTERVGLQEMGPRFTLKLQSVQLGTFDPKYGEYEWVHKRKEMDTSRRRFHL